MPAINPVKLKVQTAELIESVDSPDDFINKLHKLLDFYADRTRRSGQSGEPPSLVQAYKTPPQVIKTVERSLREIRDPDNEALLGIADALWVQNWIETRELAISILGQIPPYPSERIIIRVKNWVNSCYEDQLLEKLLAICVSQLAEVDILIFISFLEEWLSSTESHHKHIGLLSIPPLLLISDFDNLPKIFSLITPIVWNTSLNNLSDILAVLRALADRSPNETAYFLRQQLIAAKGAEISQLIRRSLSAFPPEIQQDLMNTLRDWQARSK
ncbi:MAG: DNA alkylation repair protein [Anaerolineales bacterium]|jgi:hypothetical protein